MRQHPIPQNILDVEFKLFTKFTVKEFSYLAIGVGFGGLFLYLFSVSILPGVIAVPIFLVSSLFGILLALLPVNDQGADVYMGNFVKAITRPTLRVWRNENFDQKFEWLAKQRGVTLKPGEELDIPNEPKLKKKRVIGGTSKPVTYPSPLIDEDSLNSIDREELERLAQIDQIVAATTSSSTDTSLSSATTTSSSNTLITPPIQQTNFPESEVVSTSPSVVARQDISKIPEERFLDGTIPLTTSPQLGVVSSQVSGENISSITQPTSQLGQKPTENVISLPQKSSVEEIKQLRISADTAEPYKTVVEDYHAERGKIAIFLSNESGGVPGAMVMIKDANGNLMQALQSDPQGLVLSRKVLPPGEYTVIIKDDKSKFPEALFNLEEKPIPVVNIRSI